MVFKKTTVGLRAIVAAAAMSGALGLFAGEAQAAKLGPLFPIPNGFSITGIARDSLLAIEAVWLQDGVDNINKARKETEAALEKAKAGAQDQVAALEEKMKSLDKMLEETKAELELAKNTDPARPVQKERKDKLLLNVNQWINEFERLATEQMKIAIMSDGAVALSAQQQNHQYSQFADDLQRAKIDYSMEIWGK